MRILSIVLLAIASVLAGCSTTVSYSGVSIRPSAQHPAPGTQKVCAPAFTGGSARSSGGRSTAVTSEVIVCTWKNAYGQQCESTENRVYRSEFRPKRDDDDDNKYRRPSNQSSYRWGCR